MQLTTPATTAMQFSAAGLYPITVTLGTNPNYSVTKTDGTLTITFQKCGGTLVSRRSPP